MWCYLISYDPTVAQPEDLLHDLDELPDDVTDWAAPYAGAVFIVSTHTARDLALILREETGLHGERFTIVDTATDRSGWLPKSLWTMMRDFGQG